MPPEPRILLLDVGNSAIKAGWSDGKELLRTRRWEVRVPADADRAGRDILSDEPFESAVFMSVNPPTSGRLVHLLGRPSGSVYEAGRDLPRGLPVAMEEPDRVGIDRTTTALAAYRDRGESLIVVDFGTAITFDCVASNGAFLGGAIVPGVRMIASALDRDTAFLPEVEIVPSSVYLGKSTEEAIVSGVYHALVEATNGILRGLFEEMGGRVPVIATGGDAPVIAPACPAIQEVRPDLSLEGLLILYSESIRTTEATGKP